MSGTASKVGFWRGALGAFRPVDEREFLPAALEVVETPPSPTGRALGLIIVLFFTVAVAWAVFGRVDILALCARSMWKTVNM
jgi:hemolysin D